MPFKDDIRQLADLKQQISQKMILLCSTSPKCHCATILLHQNYVNADIRLRNLIKEEAEGKVESLHQCSEQSF